MKLLIKRLIVILVVLFCVFLFFAGGAPDAESEVLLLPNPVSGDAARPHFTAYESSPARTFFQFVREPSVEILNQWEGKVRVFSLSERPGFIRVETISSDPIFVGEAESFAGPIGMKFFVDESMIRFVGDTAALQSFLAEHGITDEIQYVAALQSAARSITIRTGAGGWRVALAPVVIWVQAGGESFFIAIERHFGSIFIMGHRVYDTGTLVYRLHAHADYLELYQQRIREDGNWYGRWAWRFPGTSIFPQHILLGVAILLSLGVVLFVIKRKAKQERRKADIKLF